jgi:DNA primase
MNDSSDAAVRYHGALPKRLREYLSGRGLSDDVIDRHLLGWDGSRITIPVFNHLGDLALFKLARDPEDQTDSPKMLTTPGSHAELYGWERVLEAPEELIICEGEFDRLVLESQGFAAVTSTGGAGTFRLEWAEALRDIPVIYVCFDRDAAGEKGAHRLARILLQARIVDLPEDVGDGGDITDFFVRLGKTREDFLALLQSASRLPITLDARRELAVQLTREEIARVKAAVRLEELVARQVELASRGVQLAGRCPFHDDDHPSFVVYPETQTFHCFGCGAHGDAITFMRRIENLTFRQALDALRDIAT